MGITEQRSRGVEPVVWKYPYDPTPKQLEFHRAKAKEKMTGGAAGGGKSDCLLAEALQPILRFGVPGLLLRRTTTALGELKQRLLVRIPPEIGKWNEQKSTWTFRNGGKLMLGYLEHDNDILRYVGHEFFIICWDELTQFSEWQYRRMFHPLRVAKNHPGYEAIQEAGLEPYYASATNPGGPGHSFVKMRFIDPAPPGVVWRPRPSLEEPNPGTRLFIPSRVSDNPHMPKEYLDNLRSLPPDERRMLLDGDWDVYAGQMFPEFRRDIHVIDPEQLPIPISGVQKAQGIDYGVSNPYVCLWGALMADDQLVIYREIGKTDVLAPDQANAILSAELPGERMPSRMITPYLDPACWQREATSPAAAGPNVAPINSVAWHYQRAGLKVKRADNRRLIGWQEIKRRLQVNPKTGKPGILIYSTCTDLIRTLPELPRDKNNPEDVDTKSNDHWADALRYLAMGLYKTPPPESVTREQMRKIANSSAITAGMLSNMRT